MSLELNEKQQHAYNLMENGQNVFITGGGGVGKSFLIKYFIQNNYGNIAITSTTGISAIIIGGTTLYSYLGIGLGTSSVSKIVSNIRKKKFYRDRWCDLHTLIIDEVSMLNPELLDKIHEIAQILRRNMKPFGGIQMILSGDFCQLPCIKSEMFCFEAESWQYIKHTVYLDEIIRQKDTDFQQCLNEIRLGNTPENVRNIINKRVGIKIDKKLDIKPTKLYPLNRSVDSVNNKKLDKLINKNGTIFEYELEYKNHTKRKIDPEKMINSLPVVKNLNLTEDCQVMLIYNLDIDRGLINGSRGIVTKFVDDLPVVKFMNGEEITINYHEWEIEEKGQKIVTISQIPLRLGYAFSIHKSQGCTIDYAEIDLSNLFEYGMGYVALSRVKSLEGLFIKKINWDNIACHPKALEFYEKTKN
tara:strand:- start:488 stop:1732 length:1245 start_codon:yes stop_codon:yes gene_type:complete